MDDLPANAPRTCIFCGSGREITREHVLPNWLSQIIPKVSDTGDVTTTEIDIVRDQGSTAVGVSPSTSQYKGNVLSRKLFRVCKRCNSGWMSKLQSDARNILMPWIAGAWAEPSREDARIIVNWCGMTATVIAMSFQKTLGISKRARRNYAKTGNLPNAWGVWIARATGFTEPGYCNRVVELRPLAGKRAIMREDRPHVVITTAVIGNFLFHVISLDDEQGRPFPVEYGAKYGIFPIHPWGGDRLDFKWVAAIANGSTEFQRLKDDFFSALSVMAMGGTPDDDWVRSDVVEQITDQWAGDPTFYSYEGKRYRAR